MWKTRKIKTGFCLSLESSVCGELIRRGTLHLGACTGNKRAHGTPDRYELCG